MVSRLRDGDYKLDSHGRIVQAYGVDEIIERALIRLKAKKGSFKYDMELGSSLLLTDLTSADNDTLFMLISEALSPIREISVKQVRRLADKADKSLVLDIFIEIDIGEQGSLNSSVLTVEL